MATLRPASSHDELMDLVAIAFGPVAFAIFYLLIEALDRV